MGESRGALTVVSLGVAMHYTSKVINHKSPALCSPYLLFNIKAAYWLISPFYIKARCLHGSNVLLGVAPAFGCNETTLRWHLPIASQNDVKYPIPRGICSSTFFL